MHAPGTTLTVTQQPSQRVQVAAMPAPGRRRMRLLLPLLALVLPALLREAAAATDRAPPPSEGDNNGGGGGGGRRRRPPPPADAADPPRPARAPRPSPRAEAPAPDPSPPPPAPPSPAPPPPPYPALKLILKVTGASYELDDAQQQARLPVRSSCCWQLALRTSANSSCACLWKEGGRPVTPRPHGSDSAGATSMRGRRPGVFPGCSLARRMAH